MEVLTTVNPPYRRLALVWRPAEPWPEGGNFTATLLEDGEPVSHGGQWSVEIGARSLAEFDVEVDPPSLETATILGGAYLCCNPWTQSCPGEACTRTEPVGARKLRTVVRSPPELLGQVEIRVRSGIDGSAVEEAPACPWRCSSCGVSCFDVGPRAIEMAQVSPEVTRPQGNLARASRQTECGGRVVANLESHGELRSCVSRSDGPPTEPA